MKQFKKELELLIIKAVEKSIFIPNRVNNLISKYYSFSSECYNFITNLDNVVKGLI